MLRILTEQENSEWDAIVRSFSRYDVYWLSGYAKAFQIHGDGEPLLLYYEGDHGRAINVVMKRDIAKDPHFTGKIPPETYWDLATPYGYGGWLADGNGRLEEADWKELDREYLRYCRDNGIVSEFVRFHPMLRNHEAAGSIYDVVPLGETVAMELQPESGIWENVTSKNRNHIRKAQKSGVVIRQGLSAELLNTFRLLYNETMDREDTSAYYYFGEEFYNSIRNDLNGNAQLFYAEYDGRIIASAIMIFADDRMNYHLSGSLKEYASLAANNLLLYEAAEWGSRQGFRTFYLGGGVGSSEDSLLQFKRAFSKGGTQRFHIGKKIMLPEEYERLTAMRSDIPESGFFPRYRA